MNILRWGACRRAARTCSLREAQASRCAPSWRPPDATPTILNHTAAKGMRVIRGAGGPPVNAARANKIIGPLERWVKRWPGACSAPPWPF
jgi:hypothetical protein